MSAPLVGFSTGALARGEVARGVGLAAAAATPDSSTIELSALHGSELNSVSAAARTPAVARFARVSVHAPIKGPVPAAVELTAQLAALGCDIVCHPDAMLAHSSGELQRFSELGPALLVENNDGRKDFGASVEDLNEVFAAVPAARMCLDVSHALHAGGWDRLTELVARFGGRIAQLHVGCACGEGVPLPLEEQLLEAVRYTLGELGELPVVIERSAETATVGELRAAYAAVSSAAEL